MTSLPEVANFLHTVISTEIALGHESALESKEYSSYHPVFAYTADTRETCSLSSSQILMCYNWSQSV